MKRISQRSPGVGLASAMIAATAWIHGGSAAAQTGVVSPYTLEVTEDSPSANHYPRGYVANNPGSFIFQGSFVDWVRNDSANTNAATLVNSVASGIIPGTTGATGGKGNWWGVRIVDGIGNRDQDIFGSGGKENDPANWLVAPGSVGSAKYDITQAYLANNAQFFYFGMERRDVNGVTAFDFEFNQSAPSSPTSYRPIRTQGDVLFTFEVTATSCIPHYYRYQAAVNGFVEEAVPPDLRAVINTAPITSPPWGNVARNGNWVLTSMPAYTFAEASVELNKIPSLGQSGGCNAVAYVQVRTRSSSTDNSDLKDATRIFTYALPGSTAVATLGGGCSAFTFDSTGSTASAPTALPLSYLWTFTVPAGVTLSGTGVSGSGTTYTSTLASGAVNVAGASGTGSTITAVLTVTDAGGCVSSPASSPDATKTLTVYPQPVAVAALTPQCDQVFTFASTGSSGGNFSWTFTVPSGVTLTGAAISGASPTYTSTSASGTVTVGGLTGSATISAVLTVSNPGCSATASASVVVDPALTDKLSSLKLLDGANYTVSVASAAPPEVGTTTYQWQRDIGAGWVALPGATSQALVYGFDGLEPAVVKDSNFSITIDGLTRPYAGRVFTVPVRVVVTRTLNGLTCVKESETAVLRKVIAVDP